MNRPVRWCPMGWVGGTERREEAKAVKTRRSGRRAARAMAMAWLYEHDLVAAEPTRLAERDLPRLGSSGGHYAQKILDGVLTNRVKLDRDLDRWAVAWRVERMSTVDRAILRVALYELGHEPEVPTAVAISEAVQLADQFSTPAAKRFINGVLGRAAEELRPTSDPPSADAPSHDPA